MRTAVLLSGGLDSAVLLAEEAARGDVQPIYVSVGLAWEGAERQTIARLLQSGVLGSSVQPLAALAVDMTDIYPSGHWAVEGRPPGYHTPDKDVYLPGRNIVLLSKAGVYCATAHIGRLILGTLDHNPFPDATPVFRSAMASALSAGLEHALQIDAPYANVRKADVIRRGVALGLPLELTLSCMNPVPQGPPALPRHCGLCSKCRERHDAFLEVGISDPTVYANRRHIDHAKT
jgi:7-cyano-7-deazaguanine synthase